MRSKYQYLLFILLLFMPVPSFGEDTVTVKAEGLGDIVPGETGRARDTALEDALRKAVEQAVGTLVQSESLVRNSTLINDEIMARSEGYIQQYTILKEFREGDVYKVTVEAHVSSGKLQNDLASIGLLMIRKHKPRVMVVIPEHHLTRRIPDPAGETEIIKKLLGKGFKMVDQSLVARIRYNDQVNAAIKGDTSIAVKIGQQYGAEVVIIGEAFSESAGEGIGGMVSCRARVEARAVKTDTGEILAADGKHATGIDITEAIAGKKALQKAGSELADYMTEQILSKWSSDVTSASGVELVISGISYSQLAQFKSALSSLRGIKGLHQRSFSGNRAVIEIDLKGDVQVFADELSRKDFKGFDLEVTDFSASRMELKVLKK